jgi:hypothetical protein
MKNKWEGFSLENLPISDIIKVIHQSMAVKEESTPVECRQGGEGLD